MTKRIGLTIGVIALSLGLMLGQTGVGQMDEQGPSRPAASDDAISLQMETHMLRAISAAGLDVAQMEQLQTVFADVQSAEQTRLQRQGELRDFLYGWQGNPDELDSALQPYEQALDEARQAYQDARQSAVAQLQGVFTIAQGRALMEAFHRGRATPAQRRGAMDRNAMRRDEMDGRQGRGPPMGNPAMRNMADRNRAARRVEGDVDGRAMARERYSGQMGDRMRAPRHSNGQGESMPPDGPMMRRNRMGDTDEAPGAGVGIGPVFMDHIEMWQQVIDEKLDRLQESSS